MGTNLKFFGRNLIDDNASWSLTSALNANRSNIYDNDLNSTLQSVGSTDATPEVWEIVFTSSKTFNRLFIGNHNIKSGTLQYWNGSAYTDFSSVISWSANATANNYYEFNSVSTTKIKLTMNTTMVVNAEKFVGELRVMLNFGEMGVNPQLIRPKLGGGGNSFDVRTGGNVTIRFPDKFKGKINFTKLDATDYALLQSLRDAYDSFYVYPCGGSTSNVEECYRVQDMYFVNWVNDKEPIPRGELLGVGVAMNMELKEASM